MQSDLQALFEGITSNDQEVVNAVTRRVEEQMENPQFIFFLFQSLTEELLEQNRSLYALVQITIVNNIRAKFKYRFQPDDPIYWSPEIQQQILLTLIDAIFSIPHQCRSHFVTILQHIIGKSLLLNDISFLIYKINEIYAQKMSNVFDTNVYLQIVACYTKTCSQRITSIQKTGLLNEIETILSSLLTNVFNIIPNCIPSLQQSQDACVIIHSAIKSIRFAITVISDLLVTPVFQQILVQIFQLIVLNSNNESILKVKAQIYKLIGYLNQTFLALKKMKCETEIRLQFAQYYRAEVVPLIIQSTIQLLQLPLNYQLQKLIMQAFYHFLKYEAYNESIFTPEFLIGVLLKSAQIDEDDIYDLDVNPNLYVLCNMQIDIFDDYLTTRAFCAMILQAAIKKMNLVDELYPFFFAPSANAFEFEARLFLLFKYLKYVMKKEKKAFKELKKKQRKRVGPILPHIKEEEFNALFAQLNNPHPAFVQISLIRLISFVLKHTNPQLGFQISIDIISKSELPIIAYYGAQMFNCCSKKLPDGIPNTINIPFLINKLIQPSSIFKDDVAPSMISALCEVDVDNLVTFGPELINVLFTLALDNYTNCTSDENGKGFDAIMDNIFNIISAFEDDCPSLIQITIVSFNFAMKILSDDFFESSDKVYEILSLLYQKINHTIPIQIEMLTFLLTHWSRLCGMPDQEPSELIIVINAKEVCQIIYPLFTSDEKAIINFPDIMQNAIKLTEEMVSKSLIAANEVYNDEDGDRNDSCGYSLFLASCIVQVIGTINTSFLEAAILIITPERLSHISYGSTAITIMGALFVIAAYLITNPEMTSSLLNIQLIEAISNIIKTNYFTTYRDMVVAFILLLNFTKLGYQKAYLIAARNVKNLIKYKNADDTEEIEEEEEEEAEEEDDNDEDNSIEKIISPFQVPFDNFPAIELFKEVSAQTGLFSSLPPELQAEINELINS